MLKFGAAARAIVIAGHFTRGNSLMRPRQPFQSPVVTNPRPDYQSLIEAPYVNLPAIALCNPDPPLPYVDIAIPWNNKGVHSVGPVWMLVQDLLRMRDTFSSDHPLEVLHDLHFYRDPVEIEKEEKTAANKPVTRRNFRVNGQLQLLSSLLLNLKSQTGLTSCRCSLSFSAVPY